MTLIEFRTLVGKRIPVGTIFQNPGGGTSEVRTITDDRICYVRGNSKIYIALEDLFQAYKRFEGDRINTAELKAYSPGVFDSAAKPSGHSCNCTFFFMVLKQLSLAGEIEGSGVRGSPFAVNINAQTRS